MGLRNSTKEDNRPSDQFYPDDWCSEMGIKLIEPGAVGMWARMLWEIMWFSPKRGALLKPNGERMTSEMVAKLFGWDFNDVARWWNQIVKEEVAGTLEDGTLICRRMYYKEERKQQLSETNRKNALAKAKRKPSRLPSDTTKNKQSEMERLATVEVEVEEEVGVVTKEKEGTGEKEKPKTRLSDVFIDMFSKNNSGAKYNFQKVDGILIAGWQKKYSTEDIVLIWEIAFRNFKDYYFIKDGVTIQGISKDWNKLLTRLSKFKKQKEKESWYICSACGSNRYNQEFCDCEPFISVYQLAHPEEYTEEIEHATK